MARSGRSRTAKDIGHLLRYSPAVFYRCEPSGDYGITYITDNVAERLGYRPEEFLRDPSFWQRNVHPEDREGVLGALQSVPRQDYCCLEYRFMHRDGAYRWVLDEMRVHRGRDGRPLEFVGCWLDITGRKGLEEESRRSAEELQRYTLALEAYAIRLQENEEKYRSLVESTEDSVYLLDRECRYLYINGNHLRRLGLPADRYLRKPYGECHSEEDTRWFLGKVREVFRAGRSRQFESRGSGSGHNFLMTLSPVMAEDGTVKAITVISKDITELKTMEKRLEELSMTDELTGLYNRRGFFALAEQQVKVARRAGKSLALFSADLDGLKTINDEYGHHEGDRALVEAAMIMKESFRESDIIGRMGGDEFVVLVLEDHAVSQGTLLERLGENLEALNARGELPYPLSISIGAAHFDPASPCTINELLIRADRLMYEHKGLRRRAGQHIPGSP